MAKANSKGAPAPTQPQPPFSVPGDEMALNMPLGKSLRFLEIGGYLHRADKRRPDS